MKVSRRLLLTSTICGAAFALGVAVPASAQDGDPVRIGYIVSKTGQNAAGANTTTIPNYELWVNDVNEAGGLTFPDGSKHKIEVVTYDDRSQTEEVVRGIERLARQDEVDFILPPWGTGFNLAAAPLMARFGYPQMIGTGNATDEKIEEFRERWPTTFWMLGSANSYVVEFANVLKQAVEAGTINNKVAMVAIADGFGIELSTAARKAFDEAGIEIVMDKTYPLGTQEFGTLISEAASSGADTFMALSYPGDTFAITKQAQLGSYNPKVFYTGVGTNFPIFPQVVEGKIEGIMSLGGIDADSEALTEYRKRHEEFTGKAPDSWASQVIYTSLQMLEQAIERHGLDREAVGQELANGKFDTIIGEVGLEDNVLKDLFYVGQWQNGSFQGVAPIDKQGADEPIIPKPEW